VRSKARLKHYSLRTEQAYVDWIKRYIFFRDKPHPGEMGMPAVEAFLAHIAVAQHLPAFPGNDRQLWIGSVGSNFKAFLHPVGRM